MDNYFDLHFHPVAKNFLSRYHEPEKEEISTLMETVKMSKAFMDFTDEVALRTLESQCSIEQMKTGKVNFGVAAVSALEFGMVSSKGFFSDLIKSSLTKPFDKYYFEAVREGTVSYLNLFLREVAQYKKLVDEGKVKMYTHKNYREGFSENKPNLMLSIEGGHNLSIKKIGNSLDSDDFENYDSELFFDPKTESSLHPAEVLGRLVEYLRDWNMDVLYLGLTHMTHIPEQHLATHAFGTKRLKHPSFYPFGNGLSDLGKEVVEKAYGLRYPVDDNPNSNDCEETESRHRPVLIDVKHLSLKSRLDLYELRKGKYENIPLIASHVGVTGYSINDWKDNLDTNRCTNHVDQGIKTVKIYTKPKVAGYHGSNVKTEFVYNPCTLNLMDEDIIEVANSRGMIALGLDVSLLGYESQPTGSYDAYEFLSTADFTYHFRYNSIRSLNFTGLQEIRSEEAWLKPEKNKLHPLSLCFNIVHIVAVIALRTDIEDPWKHICVGSDFDGFIEPLTVCSSSAHMKDLESTLHQWLPVAAEKYREENGGASDLFEFAEKRSVLEKVVQGILYDSGVRFVTDYFATEKKEIEESLEAS